MNKADEISNDDNSLKKPSLCFVKTWLKQLAKKQKKKKSDFSKYEPHYK